MEYIMRRHALAARTTYEVNKMNRVIYFELPSDDPKKLSEFYARVFGWQVRTIPEIDDYYVILAGTGSEHGINGGIMGRNMDYIANHIAVDDVDKFMKLAKAKGAEMITPKMHVDQMGDFAWCADPEGNEFVLAKLDPDYNAFMNKLLAQGDPLTQVRGRMVHFELPADDPDKLVEFYTDVFGWNIQKWDGPIEYYMVSTGPESEPGIDGAIMRRGNVQGAVNTFGIGDIDAIIQKVVDYGGESVMPKEEIPGVGWFAYCSDPQGNLFGLMEPANC